LSCRRKPGGPFAALETRFWQRNPRLRRLIQNKSLNWRLF
jgi:hypothetical protein